jgi:general secretion pathway protein H
MQTSVSRISSPQLRQQAGFTLLELLVVVSLVSILTGVVVLGFTGADTQQEVKGFAQRFAFRVELARQRSLNRNREWGIYIGEQDYRFAEALREDEIADTGAGV